MTKTTEILRQILNQNTPAGRIAAIGYYLEKGQLDKETAKFLLDQPLEEREEPLMSDTEETFNRVCSDYANGKIGFLEAHRIMMGTVLMPPKIPEKRCPDCGALYNVEPCSETIHSTMQARRDEREQIADYVLNCSRDHDPKGPVVRVLQALHESILNNKDKR